MIKAVLFDMDGTLVDTLDDLTAALNFTLKQLGCPLRTKEEVRSFVGNGLSVLVELSLPTWAKGKKEEGLRIFKEYYSKHLADFTATYEGICDLVAEVKNRGYKLAVISNKVQLALDALIERFFGKSFDFVLGQRSDIPSKPAPDGVILAMDALGVAREECVYVGDSDVDLATACNARVKCISCSWGFKTKEELEKLNAQTIIENPSQLLQLI